MGWLRRNRWGLVAIVPAVLALGAISSENLYYSVYASQPRKPVVAGADGTFELQGTRIKLVDFAKADDLKKYDGSAFDPPGDVTIWRVRIEFTVVTPKADPENPDETQIGGCEITLEAADGREYDDDPYGVLNGASDVTGGGCLVDFDAPDKRRYVNAVYFALPAGADPDVVRVSVATALPSYVRLALD